MYLWDITGKRYIDCLNGFGVNIYGHNPECLQSVLREYINTNPLWQSIDLFTPERIDFVEELFGLLPDELKEYKICFPGPTGSESVEAAIQIAQKTTKRRGIFSFAGCYHGNTMCTNSLTGNKHCSSIGTTGYIYHMPFPRKNKDDCPFELGGVQSINTSLSYIRNLLKDPKGGTDIPAAMIIEPCQSDGGIIPTPPEFLKGLKHICDDYNIIFISDEVQTGFGKTGHLFGYQHANIVPDILCCSKSWGGGLPLAFTLYKDTLDGVPHSGTFRGNQIAFKLGVYFMKTFKIDNTIGNVSEIEKYLNQNVKNLSKHSFIHEVRVCGSLMGIEFVTAEKCKNIFDRFLENGLIVKIGGRYNKTLIFWCMLNLNRSQLNEIFNVINISIV